MKTNVEKFYEWMLKINNIYLNDNEQITKAFHIVATHKINRVCAKI